MRDSFFEKEECWITLATDALGRLLVVVYTWPGSGDNMRKIDET
jgi:hypothetical protein